MTVENDSAVTVPAADAAQDTGLDGAGLDDTGLDDTGIDGAGLDDTEELLVEEISIDGMCGVY
ncbi:MAG TPA: mycofactocin precursor MftA [Streptosporangiaceae bacterium]|nr:mycofactocin precursor MftA [Streptosporangiaceae bacterium]